MFRNWFEKQRIPVIITEPHSITQSERIAKFLKAFKEKRFECGEDGDRILLK